MGNSISQAAPEDSVTNEARSTSSLSVSNFTSKYLFRARKSYSLSTINPVSNEPQPSHQVNWLEFDAFKCQENRLCSAQFGSIGERLVSALNLVDVRFSLRIYFVECLCVCVLYFEKTTMLDIENFVVCIMKTFGSIGASETSVCAANACSKHSFCFRHIRACLLFLLSQNCLIWCAIWAVFASCFLSLSLEIYGSTLSTTAPNATLLITVRLFIVSKHTLNHYCGYFRDTDKGHDCNSYSLRAARESHCWHEHSHSHSLCCINTFENTKQPNRTALESCKLRTWILSILFACPKISCYLRRSEP